ncbi:MULTISPECIES: metal-dependent phosphohydrolase [unclassified Microcoleus]|uniref:metal-dependent phosphohydrolase n=1 Tax=unclassified Microcoleus TaxID=2642155 RepID=UPI00312B5391
MTAIPQAQSKLIHHCIKYLTTEYQYIYGEEQREYLDLFSLIGPQILEAIANCDAPYHNLEHTVQVVLVGQEILSGKLLCKEQVSAHDWLNFIVSLLCHDIGYLKGICSQDCMAEHIFVTGVDGDSINISPTATGASLTPYHVDRGKLFVIENFSKYELINLDIIQLNIELTRFPVPKDHLHQDTLDFPGLTRGADLIGQLSDPSYLFKLPALFSEFEEVGSNKLLGYSNYQDLRAGYPRFYWHVVSLYLKDSIRYLEMSPSGCAILDNLYGNRTTVEKELDCLYSGSKTNIFKSLSSWLNKHYSNEII